MCVVNRCVLMCSGVCVVAGLPHMLVVEGEVLDLVCAWSDAQRGGCHLCVWAMSNITHSCGFIG